MYSAQMNPRKSDETETYTHDSKAMYLDFSQVQNDVDEFKPICGVPIDLILQGRATGDCNYNDATITIPPAPFKERPVDYVFPEKVWYFLSSKTISDDIISWMPHGRAFKIKDIASFEREVIPKYFHHSKYLSFKRQLNLWNFQRVNKGLDLGCYYHPFFLRGKLNLVKRMRRQKIKGSIQNVKDNTGNDGKKKYAHFQCKAPLDFYALSSLRPLPMDDDTASNVGSLVPHLMLTSNQGMIRHPSSNFSNGAVRFRPNLDEDHHPNHLRSTVSSSNKSPSWNQMDQTGTDDPSKARSNRNIFSADLSIASVDNQYKQRHQYDKTAYTYSRIHPITSDNDSLLELGLSTHEHHSSYALNDGKSLRNVFNEDVASSLNPYKFEPGEEEELHRQYMSN